ncbi:ATP-dependent helicase [Sphaerisporangium sp. NPDC049002]|uniref:ATP-dependent helicase n=1 Tax=Sphaerisporangium sp. NPDC049002 TaxID=3155392 RepID=UPI0033E873BB
MEPLVSEIYAATPTLTPEQQSVVDQPADARVLVTAGAGAGKTHTLVRRLERLVQVEDLSAGEILVLTFSRAAVRELTERLALHGDAARHVRAQTFDSWALDLLTQVDAAGDWPNRTFEARIAGARQAIEEERADNLYEDLRHVIIDEVQDLVGSRRDLVEALLDRFDCGFTVVGDPAQSIYGFTVRDPAERAGETNRFFVWLRAVWDEDLVELELTDNFRARTPDARTALKYGPALRTLTEADDGRGQQLYDALRATLRGELLNLGALNELVRDMLTGHPGTAAILCRTNGQSLVISEQLHSLGVPHRVQRSARDRATPAWLALLLRRCEGSTLSRSRFDELITDLPTPEADPPDRLWRLLARTDPRHRGESSLDVGRLRAALASHRLPDELTAQPPAQLVVSSCHRAKGLEFDRVLVVDPGPLPRRAASQDQRSRRARREVDPAEEARLLYVAMTRPRDALYWLDALDMRHIRMDDSTGRWGCYHYQFWRRDGLEIVGGDVHTEQPAGMRDFAGDVAEAQDYLATKIVPGDEVVLQRLDQDPLALELSPPYLILHDGRPIGTVSDRFRFHLYRHLQTSKNYVPQNWPRSITGVRVDAIETVAGSQAAGIEAGLGEHGVWLAPRLVGLSHFTWDKKVQEEHSGVEAQ